MRTDNLALASLNEASYKTPFIVVELSFDEDNTDLLYLTSHAEADTPNGETVISNVIHDVSGSSQRLDIRNFNSTIGNMRFSVVDKGAAFSSYLRTKLTSDLSITNKRVRFYLGYPGVNFDKYALIQTQIVEREEVQDNTYTIRCYDVQRQQRRDIFERKETTLEQDLDFDDLTMTVLSTEGFETYFHGTSYSVNPSQTVGHLLVVDDDRVERITYTGKTGNTFTGLTRGAFGTEPLSFAAQEDNKSRNVKVYEYIYLEMPAIKLAYAILTGSLYGDAQILPAHWHLGIDSQYVATSNFTTIGADWWDTTDDTRGRIVRFEGLTKEDGKKFIETEIYGLVGCFSPILATGELGLSRLSAIVSSANYVTTLDHTNIAKASKAVYEHDKVLNFVRIDWGYNDGEDKYRRTNFFYDPQSRARHGLSDLKTLRFKGLHSAKRNGQSIHSVDDVRAMFDGLRDRFAGPPIALTLTVHPSLNTLEVGDVVLVDLTNYPDYFGDGTLKRAFEVQQVTVDWDSGKVQLRVAGSTQRAAPLIAYEGDATIPSATAVPDALYTNVGTNFETVFAGSVTRNGSVVTLNSDATFTGGTKVDDVSVLYVDGDLTVPFGVTLFIENNVFLKVKGFINEFGKIDGKGRGCPGEDYRRYMNNISYSPGDHSPNNYPDVWNRRINNAYPELEPAESFLLWSTSASATSMYMRGGPVFWAPTILGKNLGPERGRTKPWSIPLLTVNPSDLSGIPDTVWGRGGKAGSPLYTSDGFEFDEAGSFAPRARGGNGGRGGAGLIILCRGMSFGAGGQIDLSGDDGGEAPYYAYTQAQGSMSVKGADGAPGRSGLLYIFIDGALSSPPDIDSTSVIANNGKAPDLSVWPNWEYQNGDGFWNIFGFSAAYIARNLGDSSTINRARLSNDFPFPRDEQNDGWLSHSLVQFLIARTQPEAEPDEITEQPTDIELTEYTNKPQTPEGNKSTIDITVTPPSATNYSYSIIEARKSGDTGWQTVGPAQHEVSYTVDSDGSTWEFRALAVSASGNPLETGPVQSIVVTNFSGNEATIRPPSNVTGLRIAGKTVGQNTFDTPDLQFTWNRDNVLGTGYTDSWFSHFVVEIRQSNGTLIHSEETTNNLYTFTFSENAAASGGPYSSLQIRVYQVTIDGTQSGTPAQVTFTNTAASAPTSFGSSVSAYGAAINWTLPSENDLAAIELYVSTTDGFTPSSATKVFDTLSDRAQLSDLDANTVHYYVARSRDVFGNYSNYTSHYSFTTGQPDWGDLDNIPSDLWEGGNLIAPSQHWKLGAQDGVDTIYNPSSDVAENQVVIESGPFGTEEMVWQCIPDPDNDADGGWNTENIVVDTEKTYIFGVYFRKADDANGNFYLGTKGNQTYNLNNTVNSNPYFMSGIYYTLLDSDKWYLALGVLHHKDYSGSTSDLTGIYDLETGEKLAGGAEYKHAPSATVQAHRCYHFYNTSGDSLTIKQRMARPFVIEAELFPGVDALTKKLSGVEAGATVGADWNNNVDNRPSPDQIPLNYMDTSLWVVGNEGSELAVGDWSYSGWDDANSIVSGRGPFGEIQKLWRIAEAAGEPTHDDGGFGYEIQGLAAGGNYNYETDYSYRFSCYIYISADTTHEIEVYGYTYPLWNSSLVDDPSPDIFQNVIIPTGKWCLLTYIIHGEDWDGTDSGETGVYDIETGEKLFSGSEFCFRKSQTDAVKQQSFILHRIRNIDTGYAYIAKPKYERITDSTLPLVSLMGAADNTQAQVNQGMVKGLDSYASGSIFMRIHQSQFFERSSGSYSSSTLDQYSRAWLEVEDANASQYDYIERTFKTEVNTALNDWNEFADRKFRCRIDIASNSGNQNPNLLVSIATGEYYTVAGTVYAKGFGFYLDSNWDFVAFCQKSTTYTTAPQTAAMGVGTDDQISGYIDLEASYDNSAKEITFTIWTSSSQSYTQTMDLSGGSPRGHRYNGCTARIEKTGTTSNNAAWADGFYIGSVLFQQD